MGAHGYFQTYQYNDKEKIRESWLELQKDEAFESGQGPYAGNSTTFGPGLKFVDKVFETPDEAQSWILDHHQKWDSAYVVYYKIASRLSKAQLQRAAKASEKCNLLRNKKKDWLSDQISKFYKRKSDYVGCKSCGSKLNLQSMEETQSRMPTHPKAYPSCLVCGHSFMKQSQQNKLASFDEKIEAAGRASAEARRPKRSDKLGAIVGGWAAS